MRSQQRTRARAASHPTPWWLDEAKIRVSDIPSHVPSLLGGRKVSKATAWRWTLHGVRGLRIRRFRVGGAWCTTLEELGRWQAALTAADGALR